MTARGTYNQAGENVYLWKNTNNTFEYIPAEGGAGSDKRTLSEYKDGYRIPGEKGTNGTDQEARATGGGGSGGVYAWRTIFKDACGGATGTSYSGGAGGGGVYHWENTKHDFGNTKFIESNAKPNGGQGGTGFGYQYQPYNGYYNGGGSGAGTKIVANQETGGGTVYENIPAQVGTGGLLILYSDVLHNDGTISSNGSAGGSIRGNGGCSAGGAGSGAGSINIFTRTLNKKGTITATRRCRRKIKHKRWRRAETDLLQYKR